VGARQRGGVDGSGDRSDDAGQGRPNEGAGDAQPGTEACSGHCGQCATDDLAHGEIELRTLGFPRRFRLGAGHTRLQVFAHILIKSGSGAVTTTQWSRPDSDNVAAAAFVAGFREK
jgi:hypothetical protein